MNTTPKKSLESFVRQLEDQEELRARRESLQRRAEYRRQRANAAMTFRLIMVAWLVGLGIMFFFCFVQFAEADARLDIVRVRSSEAAGRSVIRRMQNQTVKYFRSYGIRLHRGWFREHKDLYPDRNFINAYDFMFEFRYWIDALHAKGWLVDRRAVNVVSPAFSHGGFYGWIAGVAAIGSIQGGGYSMSHASNQTIVSYRLSLNAMMHEVGHVLGAEHISDSVNLMHPGSGSWAAGQGRPLPLDARSVLQIRRTIR